MESSQSKARVLEKLKEDAETKLMEHEIKAAEILPILGALVRDSRNFASLPGFLVKNHLDFLQ